MRVKIWSADGRVLYSDDPAQIGGHYALGDGRARLLRDGGATVEVSDLDRPENVLDRGQGKLIEAYTRDPHAVGHAGAVRDLPAASARSPRARGACSRARAADPRGDRADRADPGSARVVADARAAARQRGARGAARQRDRGVGARAATGRRRTCTTARCRRSQASPTRSRRSPTARRARGERTRPTVLAAGDRATCASTVRDLRTLLVELHPPNLAAAGLEAAIADLVSPLQAGGVAGRDRDRRRRADRPRAARRSSTGSRRRPSAT